MQANEHHRRPYSGFDSFEGGQVCKGAAVIQVGEKRGSGDDTLHAMRTAMGEEILLGVGVAVLKACSHSLPTALGKPLLSGHHIRPHI